MSTTTSISSNVFYTILNVGANYWLSYATENSDNFVAIRTTPAVWQFLDPEVAIGGESSGRWLMRLEGAPSSCMDIIDSMPVIIQCSENTALWEASYQDFGEDGYEWTLYTKQYGYLLSQGPDSVGVALSPSIPQGTDDLNAQYALYSTSMVDNTAFSTLPYAVSTTTTTTTTTTTSTTTSETTTLTTDSDLPSTTSNEDTFVTSTIDSPISVTRTGGTSFGTSVISKSIADLGPVVSALVLPPDMNIGCKNCSISGIADVSAGGCDTAGTDYEALARCVNSGYVDMSFSDINANVSLDVELLPGFQLVDTFFSIYNVTLGSINITDLVELSLTLDYGIPLSIALATPVLFSGGFSLFIPEASVRLDLSDFSDSQVSGFEQTDVTPLPFSVSAPDIGLEASSGLSLRVHVTATTSVDKLDVGGTVTLEFGVPQMNLLAQLRTNVNNDCEPASSGTINARAVNLVYDVEGAVSASGSLSIGSSSWDSDEFPVYGYPLLNGSQCLYADRLSAQFLSTGLGSITKPSWELSISLLTAITLYFGVF